MVRCELRVLGLYCTVESNPRRRPVDARAQQHVGHALADWQRAGHGDALVGKAQALGDAKPRRPRRRWSGFSRRVVTPSVNRLLSAMRSLPPAFPSVDRGEVEVVWPRSYTGSRLWSR